jgi:uncharacterized protein YhfF
MASGLKTFKFGWYGDGGLGERLIQDIVSGRKTATSCLAYETEDAGLQEGDRLNLVDKRGTSYATLVVTKIEIRHYGTFDESIARASGTTLAELKAKTKFANGREPWADEDMRVVYFKVVGPPLKNR